MNIDNKQNEGNSVQISENQFKMSSQGEKIKKEHKKQKKMDKDMIEDTNKKLKHLIKSKRDKNLEDGLAN